MRNRNRLPRRPVGLEALGIWSGFVGLRFAKTLDYGPGLVGSGLVWVGLLVSSDTFTVVFARSENGVDF